MVDPVQASSVMVYVQHLLGIGHLKRVWYLSCALVDHGMQVDLVTGGMPIQGLEKTGIRIHQLDPVRSPDSAFNRLVNSTGEEINERWKAARRDHLLKLFDDIKPRVLITETFPFGRRMMRFELLPLLEHASATEYPPIIVSSIRDILQPKQKAGRNEEIIRWIESYYQHVLIHGDPELSKLSLSFPLAEQIADKLHYTGYISHAAASPSETKVGIDEVIVSGGGGAASLNLLQTAIAAQPLSQLPHRCWRILVGNNLSEEIFSELKQSTSQKIIVERNRDDFQSLLKHCSVSVSQAGYNTVMDILNQNTAAVLVPFADGEEVEQSLRAQQLEKISRVVCLEESKLNAESLAQAVDKASQMKIVHIDVNRQGSTNSARLIRDWLND